MCLVTRFLVTLLRGPNAFALPAIIQRIMVGVDAKFCAAVKAVLHLRCFHDASPINPGFCGMR
jgi:hypothetical protein